jgi:alpha-N-arabinofuranosidase
VYHPRKFPLHAGGNVYYNGARPYGKETNPVEQVGFDPTVRVVEQGDRVFLHLTLGQALENAATKLVTTELLGKARISGLAYENADGSPVVIDQDYFGKSRDRTKPSAGPFESPGAGKLVLEVW